jgi:hypothetical protein
MRRTTVALLLVACGAAKTAPGPTSAPTALAPGDYVVYRFTRGASRVDMTEQILAREQQRLVVDVLLSKGGAQRHLVQVMRNNEDDVWSGAAVELYVVAGDGTSTRVPSDAATLLHAYEWVQAVKRGAASDARGVSAAPCESVIGGARFACTCESVTVETTRMEARRCPGFGWQRGPARWTDTMTGAEVWRADIVEVGHGRPATTTFPDARASALDVDDDPMPPPRPMPPGDTWAGDYTNSAGQTLHLEVHGDTVSGTFRPASPPPPPPRPPPPDGGDPDTPGPPTEAEPSRPEDICAIAPGMLCVGWLRDGQLSGTANGDVLRFEWTKHDMAGRTTRGSGYVAYRVGAAGAALVGVCDDARFRWTKVR